MILELVFIRYLLYNVTLYVPLAGFSLLLSVYFNLDLFYLNVFVAAIVPFCLFSSSLQSIHLICH